MRSVSTGKNAGGEASLPSLPRAPTRYDGYQVRFEAPALVYQIGIDIKGPHRSRNSTTKGTIGDISFAFPTALYRSLMGNS